MTLIDDQVKIVTRFAVWMAIASFGGGAFGLDVGKYDTFETNVMNYNSYSNPFQNVTLNATFTSPSSQNTSIRGFYDGNNTWRVRFMPDQLGTWTYTCTFSDGAPGKSGSFSCVAGNLHGPLKTDTATPLWFEHADGTPFFMRAFHLWRPETFTESILEETLDFMKANGLNVVDGPHLANWGTGLNQIPWEGSDYTNYKLSVWRQLDVYVRKCAERGIVVFPFSILGGTNGIPKMSTWDQRQRFIRYWVARWGGFWNVAYCPVSEYAEAYSTAEGMQILNEIYNSDGGRHPVSIHPGNTLAEPATEIKTMTAYTYHTVQEKLDDWNPARYQQLITLYNTANKPIFAQETLWEGNKYQPDSSRDMNNMRKAAWITTTYGGQISYADECMPGHLPQDNDETACYAMHGASVDPQGWFYPYFSHLADFMESVPFWRMSLQPSLAGTGNCLAKTDYWYVAYTMGGSFTLNLSAASSSLVGRWYDPRNGTFGSPFSVSPGGVRTMTPPDSSDWVLYVCRDVDSTPPAAVSSFTVTAGEYRNTLVWTNPSSSDFIATVIRCKTTGYPTSPTDGQPVVNLANPPGTTNTYVHSGLNAGATYYYTAFARDDEYHYATGVQASAIPHDYKRVSVDLGTTDIEQGICNVQPGDGDTIPADIGGENCRRNAVAGADNYMYFNVADAHMYAGYRPVCYVSVEYYDTGTGTLTLHYDSTSGAYTSGGTITLTDSDTWKIREFALTDAYFGNRQNDGADFRIACTSGVTFYLDEVAVSNISTVECSPLINPFGWSPDAAYVGAEYVRQLTLAQGRPLPSWTILRGPSSAVIDGSGLLSGWTPSAGEDGQTITFQVEVTNSQGSDTEEWSVTVGPAPLATYEAEGAGMGHLAGSAIPGGWRITPANPNTFSTYGPYTSTLLGGPLKARFWLRVDNNTADNNGICQLDVYDADEATLLAGPMTITRQQWTAAGVYQPFELAFTNPGGGHRLEFRTYYLGHAQLDQDRVDIYPGGNAPPVIAEVSPDPDTAMVAVEYVRQLTLLQGYPTPTWSVIQGPSGLQVNANGMAYGWSPTSEQEGQSFTITIRATNTQGSDEETWTAAVQSNLAGMVFEDTLANSSKVTGQRGDGIFSTDGYTLTQSVSNCSVTGNARSGDFVYYELGRSAAGGSWAQGTIEWDLIGLSSQSCPEWNEHIAICDSYGISPNPAWDNGSFYNSPNRSQQRKLNEPANPQHIDKMKPTAACEGVNFEDRTNVLEWNATTVYRFRISWGNGEMRWYRGIPGNTLTELVPPGSFNYSGSWDPQTLHIQLGSTFRAYRTGYSGGVPGSRYSLIRVYKVDIGNAATPPRTTGPVAPVICEVAPDPDTTFAGSEYVRQLNLCNAPSPTPTWSVISGPAGVQVSDSGYVSGWTPTSAQVGQRFTISVRASNSAGADDESWQVDVLDSPTHTVATFPFASDAEGWTLAGWKAGSYNDGTMVWDSVSGNPTGNLKANGNGSTNGTDSCTREGGSAARVVSTAGYNNIQIEYDVIATLNTPPGSGCTGTCMSGILEGSCEDKLAVYYSTAGIGGPWTLAQALSEGVDLPTTWTRNFISLAGVPAANDNVGFALRFIWQFNTTTDTGRIDNVTIKGDSLSGNQPPTVDAGSDQTVTLPNSANLAGTASDDGLPDPPGTITVTWSKHSGPGTVTFGDANALNTTASFSFAGVYVLKLFATDSQLTGEDTVTITVNESAPADLDGDGDVDQADFGIFQACLSGPGVPYESGCENADFDESGAVDQDDFAVFLGCLGGPGSPPGC